MNNLQTSTRASIALASLVITLSLFQSVSSLGRVQHHDHGESMAKTAVVAVVAAR